MATSRGRRWKGRFAPCEADLGAEVAAGADGDGAVALAVVSPEGGAATADDGVRPHGDGRRLKSSQWPEWPRRRRQFEGLTDGVRVAVEDGVEDVEAEDGGVGPDGDAATTPEEVEEADWPISRSSRR